MMHGRSSPANSAKVVSPAARFAVSLTFAP
jgi:hypothetical protein